MTDHVFCTSVTNKSFLCLTYAILEYNTNNFWINSNITVRNLISIYYILQDYTGYCV